MPVGELTRQGRVVIVAVSFDLTEPNIGAGVAIAAEYRIIEIPQFGELQKIKHGLTPDQFDALWKTVDAAKTISITK